jgi:hypothetical protein
VMMLGELGSVDECIEIERNHGLLGPIDVQQVLMLQKQEMDKKEKVESLKSKIIKEKCSAVELEQMFQ